MTLPFTAAILPSRNEPTTIAAVTTAADQAMGEQSVIVHADSSDAPDTAARFASTPTRAGKVALTGLRRGKGAQILAALRHPELAGVEAVLIADTDTRAPDPALYRALLDQVRGQAAFAIADYPRHWDEANLTNHLARPLIAATTGHDVPQPLAGDLALTRRALDTVTRTAAALPPDLAPCVDGYGIDAFLLLTAAGLGPLASVRTDEPKRHAASFPHLAVIFRQAVPVLLHLTARRTPTPAPTPDSLSAYRTDDRVLAPDRLTGMLTTLENLTPGRHRYDDERPWPLPVVDAWRAVNSGTPPTEAAAGLWPHYLRRVHDWLTCAQHATAQHRAVQLAAAHVGLHTDLTSAGASK
ncbi:hypothetical protein RM717_04400 [Streptomyces griseus]|uniref:Glycosyltransferase n=1 Tax=Streptomyces stephensoniae TaxID=3375367 RepID=A0ABU2VWV0_9ACTN|nr:hypothetical protein [Streptomyces griseus]MDT0489745.1 hypothetical protein [Streptomyces griseus]